MHISNRQRAVVTVETPNFLKKMQTLALALNIISRPRLIFYAHGLSRSCLSTSCFLYVFLLKFLALTLRSNLPLLSIAAYCLPIVALFIAMVKVKQSQIISAMAVHNIAAIISMRNQSKINREIHIVLYIHRESN